VPGRRLIPLPSICETPRSSRGLRVSSFEPRLKAQEFGLWHPLDSWLIPHLEPLAGSALGVDCVSVRAARGWREKAAPAPLNPNCAAPGYLKPRPEWRLLELLRPPSPDLAFHTELLFDSLLSLHKVFGITIGSGNK
jgi:hypothetical protein